MSEPTNPFFMTRNQLVMYSKRLEEENKVLKSKVEEYDVSSVHTCSKGCTKKGCSRGLHEEIERLKAEIERLKEGKQS